MKHGRGILISVFATRGMLFPARGPNKTPGAQGWLREKIFPYSFLSIFSRQRLNLTL
jgi:hypothetical protein